MKMVKSFGCIDLLNEYLLKNKDIVIISYNVEKAYGMQGYYFIHFLIVEEKEVKL